MAWAGAALATAAIAVGAAGIHCVILGFHRKSRWQVQEAPREWVWQICYPLVKGTAGIALFGSAMLIPYYLLAGHRYACCLQLVRLLVNGILTSCLHRNVLSYRTYCLIGYPLHMVDICTTVWSHTYTNDFAHRHRNTGMVAIFWRLVAPFYACDFKLCITELVWCTAAEVLALRASALHFGEGANIAKHYAAHCALTVIAVVWVYVWCAVFRTFHQTLQEVKVEKEATTSILSMLCDASFWLAADGDTLLGNGRRLETVLGKSVRGGRLSQCIPPEEHSRLRALFESLPGSGETSPVHLLPTAVMGPDATTQAVDLFIVDRRLAFSAGMGDWVLTEEQRQATSRRQGFLVGLRFARRPGGEPELGGAPHASEALDEKEAAWVAPSVRKHAAPRPEPSSCGSTSEASMPVGEGAAPGPCDQGPQPGDAAAPRSEASQPAGSRRRSPEAPAPSSIMSSCSGSHLQVHEHNSFLTVAGRRPRLRRRAESAPPRISCHAAPAAAPEEAPEEECSECGSAESSVNSGSSVVAASVFVNGCDDPRSMGLRGSASCVHLTDLLGIKARGWQSCGSWGHALGLCKICKFHKDARGGSCIKGTLCMRCHEQYHEGIVSRSLRRRHNKRNGLILRQWGSESTRLG